MRIGFNLLLVLLAMSQGGRAQGFTNLNFESATLVPVPGDPYNSVYFAQAFPGWTVSQGGWPNALYNNTFLDSSGISIIDHNWTNSQAYILGINHGSLIQGNYAAILQAGYGFGGMTNASISLSQTGLVPAGTQSLRFDAFQETDGGGAIIPFAVMLGNQTLSLVTISNALNCTVYGVDVSEWAGQLAQLSFTVFAENPHIDDQYLYLDAIQFSPDPVPEPSVIALFTLGTLWISSRHRRKSSG